MRTPYSIVQCPCYYTALSWPFERSLAVSFQTVCSIDQVSVLLMPLYVHSSGEILSKSFSDCLNCRSSGATSGNHGYGCTPRLGKVFEELENFIASLRQQAGNSSEAFCHYAIERLEVCIVNLSRLLALLRAPPPAI